MHVDNLCDLKMIAAQRNKIGAAMDMNEEDKLEAQLKEVQAKLDAVRAANREAVLTDVKAKIKKYGITRTELASAFPVLRRSSASSSEPVLNADGTVRKRRGRKPKAEAGLVNL